MNQLVLSDEILQGISDLANQLNLSIDSLLEQIVKGNLAVVNAEELEDLLDVRDAMIAEAGPENQERVSWETFKNDPKLSSV
jgi:uncharacterized protein YdhG (YjbR/CyaY superfamily)